jgi:hypothetical protein
MAAADSAVPCACTLETTVALPVEFLAFLATNMSSESSPSIDASLHNDRAVWVAPTGIAVAAVAFNDWSAEEVADKIRADVAAHVRWFVCR